MTDAHPFPTYTRAERVADDLVHLVGLAAATAALAWLFVHVATDPTALRLACVAIYAAGLLGMLAASFAYNLARPGRLKGALRRIDHAMIYVMIAGSYTPFTLVALPHDVGVPLCITIWAIAAGGAALALARPRRGQRLAIALYLGLGWIALGVTPALIAALSAPVLLLLAAGGLLYSLGTILHTRVALKFHNALWHAAVVIAAALHLGAIAATV